MNIVMDDPELDRGAEHGRLPGESPVSTMARDKAGRRRLRPVKRVADGGTAAPLVL
jgi:hypothetical protein